MAFATDKALRNQVMYSAFVRQYSKEGTFRKVQEDLNRIRDLGADILWLMPIHPIGLKGRKGSLGSPYAIRDYRTVNPEFGTLEDFRSLVSAVHDQGMKCVIDVVYNHTSPDSWLALHHPEWFYHKADGSFGNRVGEWTDVIDLDYSQRALWDYQIDTLKYWAGMVDGFRCDVAPLLPLEFWLRARAEVEKVRPGCIWLSESVEPSFTLDNRERGMVSLSDSEIFQAFDISYEYDVYGDMIRLLCGECGIADYAARVNAQESDYPDNYVKLRFLENHDRPRAALLFPDAAARRNMTAFLFFQKGMTLLYNGQEAGCAHRPSLFERDSIDWAAGENDADFLKKLAAFKRHPLLRNGRYRLWDGGNGMLCGEYRLDGKKLLGFFNLRGQSAVVRVQAPDGLYENLLGGGPVRCESGLLSFRGEPAAVEIGS